MNCPDCLERIHSRAEECPHCGMTLEQLSTRYTGIQQTVTEGVHDAAGVLNNDATNKIRNVIKRCEKQFTGVNLTVSFVALKDQQSVASYGFWLINTGEFYKENRLQTDIEEGRGRVILIIDIEGKRAGFSFGYFFDGYIRPRESFNVLSAGHASLLEGSTIQGCTQILESLKNLLKKVVTRAKKGSKR